jgi:hypothetical protein
LLPSSALSSAQVFKAYPKIAALENRTFHLLFKPDILTCYEQQLQSETPGWEQTAEIIGRFLAVKAEDLR